MDVTTIEPVAAFCSSDEENEDTNALQYLPISPEVEEPEEGWAPGVLAPPNERGDQGTEDASIKRSADQKENTSPNQRRKKFRSFDIELEGVPTDGKYRHIGDGFYRKKSRRHFHIPRIKRIKHLSAWKPRKETWIRELDASFVCCVHLKKRKKKRYKKKKKYKMKKSNTHFNGQEKMYTFDMCNFMTLNLIYAYLHCEVYVYIFLVDVLFLFL